MKYRFCTRNNEKQEIHDKSKLMYVVMLYVVLNSVTETTRQGGCFSQEPFVIKCETFVQVNSTIPKITILKPVYMFYGANTYQHSPKVEFPFPCDQNFHLLIICCIDPQNWCIMNYVPYGESLMVHCMNKIWSSLY